MKSLIDFIRNYSAEKKMAQFLVVYGIVEGIIPEEKSKTSFEYAKKHSFYLTLKNYFIEHAD